VRQGNSSSETFQYLLLLGKVAYFVECCGLQGMRQNAAHVLDTKQ